MQPRKMVGITIEKTNENCYPSNYEVTLTYCDLTRRKILLNGREIAHILDKNFDNISLCGPFVGNFRLEAGADAGNIHRETLIIKDVLTLFNSRGYLEEIDTRENLLKANEENNHKKPITQCYRPSKPYILTEEELKLAAEIRKIDLPTGPLVFDETRKMYYIDQSARISPKK